MGIREEVAKAKVEMADVAELIIDKGYTAEDFKLVLSRLILDEIEYIELQHTDAS